MFDFASDAHHRLGIFIYLKEKENLRQVPQIQFFFKMHAARCDIQVWACSIEIKLSMDIISYFGTSNMRQRVRLRRVCANLHSQYSIHYSSWHTLRQLGSWSGPEVITLFSCSTQLSMKFQLLIKIKISKNEDVSWITCLRYCVYHANKC